MDNENCHSSTEQVAEERLTTFSAQGYPSLTNGDIIAIAKDGHVVYGPYQSNGQFWGCFDHDICNGRFFDDGHYAYVATREFPYILGCWGPAADLSHTIDSSCATNVCHGTSELTFAEAFQLSFSLGSILFAIYLAF